jgi:hypothetical protein
MAFSMNIRPLNLSLAAIGLTLSCGGAALAADREWVSFDNSPPGTAPTIEVMPDRSSADLSVFEIRLHGMWIEEKSIPGTTESMQAVSLPGDGAMATNALGLPELPGVGIRIASMSRTTNGESPNFDFELTPYEQVVLENVNVYPTQRLDATDEDGGDGDQRFYFDGNFYQSTTSPFPLERARVSTAYHQSRGVGSLGVVAACMECVPASRKLIVSTKFEFKVHMPGAPIDQLMLTPRAAAMFDFRYDNAMLWWQHQLAVLNFGTSAGDYLIVTPRKYIDELTPLIRQKTERGLTVTIVRTETLGTGYDQHDVKAAISDWFDGCDDPYESYVLLIGDVDEMPMHVDPLNSLPSDHYYVCLDDEFFPSCQIGRYSCDSEVDLEEQIAKTISYSEDPLSLSMHYKRALLAAHEEEPKEYVECIEDIADADYVGHTPNFTMYSGREAGSTTANVVADINDKHFGLVMYRGHGWKKKWGSNWNILGEELWREDVEDMTNGRYTPVVVSVACGNSHIHEIDDCIGEVWMEGTENGAVAHIGSIRSSNTTANHYFAKAFNQYYWSGINMSIGDLMQSSWLESHECVGYASYAKKNMYMSQLLGDPELRPWQQAPFNLVIRQLPQFLIGSHSYQFELEADEPNFNFADVIMVATVDGEIRSMARANTAGAIEFDLDLEEGDAVIVRAHAELAFATDARGEGTVDAPCEADLDGSGDVGIDDLLLAIGSWGTPSGDITGDGTTNIDDLLGLIAAFGPCQ